MINAELVARLRTERGLSQRRLAYFTGVNFQVIRRIEAGGDDGNLTLRHLAHMCEALGVHPRDLLAEVTIAGTADEPEASELTTAQARLLRRIQLGEDVRRSLSGPDRELVLPALVRRGLVTVAGGRPIRLTKAANADLTP
ncbi:helix-turn-helix domain-containing protein [Longivirga aurantiaca]|uniref:Helix-turn-helix domain-containing protein n=1 Tax=Longivirga aurantiaca TaxID=1837743 RepID=A0ABW1T0F0_9ACTN